MSKAVDLRRRKSVRRFATICRQQLCPEWLAGWVQRLGVVGWECCLGGAGGASWAGAAPIAGVFTALRCRAAVRADLT